MSARETENHLRAISGESVREVPPIVRSKSDRRHYTPGPDQIGESGKGFLGTQVMKGGHRYHSVERTVIERNVEHVALLPFDGDPGVACFRPLEDLPVQVEPDDVRDAGPNQLR